MRHLWLVLHLLGFTMWLGGGLSAMFVGLASKREARDRLSTAMRMLAAIYQALVLPGSLLAVVSGLVLTLMMYGGPTVAGVSHWLMAMQGLGLAAAVITLVVLVPGAGKLVRVDPVAQAELFDALRKKQARFGMISGLLGLLALVAGGMGR